MIRQSIGRCIRLQAPRGMAIAVRNGPVAARFGSQSVLRAARPVSFARSPLLPLLSRYMSSEAAAAAEQEPAEDEPQVQAGNITRFADLRDVVHPNLIRAFVEDMGYETMTPVQAATITPGLQGKDLVAQAKTGTGKTIGFLLPLLQRMLNEDPLLVRRSAQTRARCDDIRGIILSPTRELAEQIAEEARRVTKHTGLVTQCAVGGTNKMMMLKKTQREGCHLLVATPGRLNDLLSDPRSGIAAPNLAAMVLDEADRMLDVGFMPQLEQIQRLLPDRKTKERQTLLFSATIPREVVGLARQMVRVDNFDFIQTISANDTPTHEKVPQSMVFARGHENLFPALFELLEKLQQSSMEEVGLPFKAVVYFNYTAYVKLAEFWSRAMGYGPRGAVLPGAVIHSGLSQIQRERAANFFRMASTGVLFSSDVTARGMDFPNVSHVIQVGLPQDADQYVHRVGRTGRQNKAGQGWIIVPRAETAEAKRMLGHLPLKVSHDVASASYNCSPDQTRGEEETEAPAIFDKVTEAAGRIPADAKNDAYMVSLSQGSANAERVKSINTWVTRGMGLDAPPSISRSWANKLGISRVPGINIRDGVYEGKGMGDAGSWGSRSEDSPSRGRFGGDRSSSFGDRTGGFGGRSGGFGGRSGGSSSFGDRSSGFGGDRSGGRSGGSGGFSGGRSGGRSGSSSWNQRGSSRKWE